MKPIKSIIKIQIPAGEATPAPPVGPILAPQGINLQQFCSAFNDQTKAQKGWIIPVVVTIFEDSSFKFITKQPPASQLIKKAAGIEKGSGQPLVRKTGKISREQLKDIAEKKMPDLNTTDIEKAIKIIEGTAKAMGVEVE